MEAKMKKEVRALVERLRRISSRLDICECEEVLQAADAIPDLLGEIERLETRIRSLDHALNFILSDAAWTPKHPACESIINRINALRKGNDR